MVRRINLRPGVFRYKKGLCHVFFTLCIVFQFIEDKRDTRECSVRIFTFQQGIGCDGISVVHNPVKPRQGPFLERGRVIIFTFPAFNLAGQQPCAVNFHKIVTNGIAYAKQWISPEYRVYFLETFVQEFGPLVQPVSDILLLFPEVIAGLIRKQGGS